LERVENQNEVRVLDFRVRVIILTFSWGRFGFDRTFGGNRLRVGELFSVINGQNKLNANNIVEADFTPAYAVAA